MNKKPSKCALVALFLALVVLAPLAGIVAGDRVRGRNLELRTPAAKPALTLEHIGSFPREYEAWYADSQPFRDQLIYVRALMNKALYDRDVTRMVAFGKQGWLFYTNVNDGKPLNNYRGEDLFTNMELRRIADSLVRTRDNLRKQGCEFVLFIAPNKERVYSEYMPDRYGAPSESYGVKQLVRFLRQRTDLKVVYCHDEIMQARQDFPDLPLYFSRDTHWNDIGSYIGTRALMRALGYELPALTRDMIRPSDREGPNDLVRLAHLTSFLPPDLCYDVTVPADALPAPDVPKQTLYFRHDSFGVYMQGFLAPWFAEGGVTDATERDDAQVDAAHPDVFVMEVLERFVRRRLWAGPLYASPENPPHSGIIPSETSSIRRVLL